MQLIILTYVIYMFAMNVTSNEGKHIKNDKRILTPKQKFW